MTLVKQASELFQILIAKKSIDNATIASGSEARSWLKELKSEGYVRYDKKENMYLLVVELPTELTSNF